MSKNPKKNNMWWLVLLVVIFAPGILGFLVKAAFAVCIPLAVIAIVLAIVFRGDKKKKAGTAKTEQAQASAKIAEESAKAAEEKTEKALKKKLNRLSRSRLFTALATLCYVTAGCSGLGAAISAVESAARVDILVFAVIALWFLGCGAILHLLSAHRKQRARDAFRYLTLIGDKESCSLEKLSSATSYKIDRVRRDLERMIDEGFFGDKAYIDMSALCFMRTPDAIPASSAQTFSEYTRTMSSVSEDLRKNAPPIFEQTADGEDSEAELSEFDAILRRIRRLDEEILDESVSERIRSIESATRNIFDYVQDKPEKMRQIRAFMNYYLPTTLKLLESYSRIERVGVAGQNMQEAKDNIEQILDMLTVGFQQQFDQLFKAESLDITSDIEVLEQMKKDGLSENTEFVIREKELEEVLHAAAEDFSDDISDDLSEEGGTAAQRKN